MVSLLVFAGAALVLLAGPLALASFALRGVLGNVRRALAVLLALLALAAVVVAAYAAVVAGLPGGIETLLTCLVVLAVGGVLPLALAAVLAERVAGVPDGAPYAAVGWPVSLYAAAVVFLAPGGFARYNLTFATGLTALVGWSVFLLLVLFGPSVVAVVVARYSTSRANSAP